MKKFKIISILAFSPRQEILRKRFNSDEKYIQHHRDNIGGIDYLKIEKPTNKVFFYHTEFFHIQAKEILKRTDKYDIECWRPYIGINRVYSKNIDGITNKAIPQYEKKDFLGRSTLESKYFQHELKKEIEKEKVLIIHSYPGGMMTKIWGRLKPFNIPIIAIHRGGALSKFLYLKKKGYKKVTTYIQHIREIKTLKHYIDNLIETVKLHTSYLEKKGINKTLPFFPDGVDFDLYKPINNKKALRSKLGLPIDKKIIIYVGRFSKVKDVDFLIEAYNELKRIRDDIQLLLIGGNIEEEYYDFGVKSGAIMVERLSQKKLVEYQQAADVYVLPTNNYVVKNFGGIGSAVIQSLACGIPVISDNLMHFQGSEGERNKVGLLLKDKETLKNNIGYVLENRDKFANCREYAYKYYHKDICMKKLISIINELFGKYYGEWS